MNLKQTAALGPKITALPTINEGRNITEIVPGLEAFALSTASPTTPIFSKVGSVPIYANKISHIHQNTFQTSGDTSFKAHDGKAQNLVHSKEPEYKVSKFLDMKIFRPDSLISQLNELAVLNFPNIENEKTEKVLNVATGGNAHFVWSFIEDVDKNILFIRFTNEDNTENIKGLISLKGKLDGLKLMDHQLEVELESNTIKYLEDSKLQDTEVDGKSQDEELIKEIEQIIKSKNDKKKIAISEFDDYQIDESELQDLPPEVIPQLKEDIKEFRLKVLQNEKLKRQKESMEEIKRSKQQLRKLFEKFKIENNEMLEDDDEDDEDDDEHDGNQGDELTDEQFERMRLEREKHQMLRRYNEKLRIIQQQQRKNNDLIDRLTELQEYEPSLDKSIKEDYEFGKFRPSNRDKFLEIEKDEADRQAELKENELLNQSEDFLSSIKIPLKLNIQKDSSSKKNQTLETIDDEGLTSILTKIKPKIEEYIEKFLGIKEDELLEYIVMIIKENKNKASLIQELEETFDDDATQIGDQIWKDIESLL